MNDNQHNNIIYSLLTNEILNKLNYKQYKYIGPYKF